MLELIALHLSEGEVKVEKTEVPEKVDVNISVDRITVKKDRAYLDFTYIVDYSPKVAKVTIKGTAHCTDTEMNLKKLVADWKKKIITPELGMNVLNEINANVGVNSIFLMRPFNLMPPFMPPLVVPPEEVPLKEKK